ncbi:unnamed protein product [Agarophyton chilense]
MLSTYDSDSSEESVAPGKLPFCAQNLPEESLSITPEASGKPKIQSRSPSFENCDKQLAETSQLNTTKGDIPAELAVELRRAGHDLADVKFIDINATTKVRVASSNDHIPASALRNTATRLAQQISKSRNVGRIARRKHQITALAADALALQAAQAVLPGSASQRKR